MVKAGLRLLLLLSLLGASNAYACYCTSPYTTDPNTGVGYCRVNPECWACVPGAYDPNWQQYHCTNYTPVPAPVTCSSTYIEKEEACPVNYSGQKRYRQEITTCTDGSITTGAWQLYADTCTQNPPTCQTMTEARTLACSTGYIGAVSQTRSSSCPDPYGSPQWNDWITINDSCEKSLTNATNPISPVSPINPASPLNTQAPIVVPSVDMPVMASPAETGAEATSTETKSSQQVVANSAENSENSDKPASGSTSSGTAQRRIVPGFGLVLSLELFVKPGIVQPNIFPDVNISQELPNEYRRHQDFLLNLITTGDVGDYFDRAPNLGWERLRGDNFLQQNGFND
jgi:hypothetical protein